MGEFELKDKVVLITGSSRGIGEAIARFASAAGAKVVVNSSSSVADGEAVANSLADAIYVQGDITSEADVKRLVDETVRHFGRLDVLINNAGRTKVIAHHDLEAASTSVFREIFEVNVFGTWEMTMAAMEELKASRGAIVNVTSIAGIRPTGSSIPYAASKAALNHLTVLLAKVAGPDVTVNAVAPGLVDTPWTESWVDLKNAVSHIAPMRRTATPDDVAKAVLDVATSRYITGQVIVVDGGLTIAT